MPEGSNPAEGSQADLATEVLASQQAASAAENPTSEEQAGTPDASDASAEDQAKEASPEGEGTSEESEDAASTEDELQYERLSAKLKAGRALSKVDLKAIEDLERRSVPYKVYTQANQKHADAVRAAEAKVAAAEARAKQLDEALPILEALAQNKDAVKLIEDQLSVSQRQTLDPALAPVLKELQQLRSEVEATKAASGDRFIQEFIEDHSDLSDDPYLQNKWVDAAYKAAQLGVDDPLATAYDIVKVQVARERNPQQAKLAQAKKQVAAMPTGSARAPQPAPAKSEADQLLEQLLSGVQPLQGVKFQ